MDDYKYIASLCACVILTVNSVISANIEVGQSTQEEQFLLRVPVPASLYMNSEVRMSTRYYPDNVEVWKDIKGYEGLYQASTFGRIRSLARYITNNKGVTRLYRGCVLKGGIQGVYLGVNLCKEGRKTTKPFHCMVLETFDRFRNNGEECRHLDGNPLNNHISNLRWGTVQENAFDRVRHGTSTRGIDNNTTKLTEVEVLAIRKIISLDAFGFDTIGALFNVSGATVSKINCNKNWGWLSVSH